MRLFSAPPSPERRAVVLIILLVRVGLRPHAVVVQGAGVGGGGGQSRGLDHLMKGAATAAAAAAAALKLALGRLHQRRYSPAVYKAS